jgi:DNA polymerase III alpha subunit
MGLSSVAGCGDKAADEIISNQPYESFDDFLVKVQKRKVNIKIQKNLIQAGAFDKFGRRDELYYSLSDETFEKWDKEEILKREMLVLDLPSKEPLINYYENKYPHIELTDIDQIDFSDPIGEVWIKGIITNFVTKKASTKLEEAIDVLKEMVYFDIDDGTMKVNCFMSPEMFDLYKPLIGDGEAVILKAHTFGQKVYIDGVLNLTKENNISLEKYSIDRRQDEVDNMHRKPRWSINAVQSITYHVSKNGKRYGRITYDDGNFGLCFNMKVEDIQPGEIICWTTSKNPFINIVKRVE